MNHTLDADGNLVSINDIPLTPRSVPLMSQARWGTEPLSIPMGYASQDPQPMSSNDREILQDEELGYSSENEEDEEGAGSFRTASSGSPSKDESTFSHHVEGSSSSDTSAHGELEFCARFSANLRLLLRTKSGKPLISHVRP
ncbi:hypothetical protein FRC03_004715 [Tulasnella sp. 419]|nr:hypothetical protein FRC03_004715 [Tulasnella sp. 419]